MTAINYAHDEVQADGALAPASTKRRGRKRGISASVERRSYEERVALLSEDDFHALSHFLLGRIFTRALYAETLDPVACNHEWLAGAGLIKRLPAEELERRLRAAYRKSNKQINHYQRLGFLEANQQKKKLGDEKDLALRVYGTKRADGLPVSEATSRRYADAVHLTSDGLRAVTAYCQLSGDETPTYQQLATSLTHLSHQLAATRLYTCLYALTQIERIELLSFEPERSWEVPDGKRRPRSDVFLRVAPYGLAEPILDVAVEVDRGNQSAKVANPSPLLSPTKFVAPKFDAYFDAARRRNGKPLHLAFVVPAYSRVSPETRARDHARLAAIKKSENPDVSNLRIFITPNPTIEEFVLALLRAVESQASASPARATR